MINDELIWTSLDKTFCSFRSKVQTHNFCRNEYNVTGLCNKSACPLANGKYATIREHEGKLYLYQKTIERAHMPRKLWQRTLLPRNYEKALELVSRELEYYPKFLQHRNKQRLTRIHQYLMRMRKIASKRVSLVTVKAKDKREDRREVKALVAAKLNDSIKEELLQRLQQGTYGDIYNFPEAQYSKALEEAATEAVEDEDDDHLVEFVEGFESDDDVEEVKYEPPPALTKKKPKRRRVEIEYDDDLLTHTNTVVA